VNSDDLGNKQQLMPQITINMAAVRLLTKSWKSLKRKKE
jgi:hypothetical protein